MATAQFAPASRSQVVSSPTMRLAVLRCIAVEKEQDLIAFPNFHMRFVVQIVRVLF
jgi:hypothetical protein